MTEREAFICDETDPDKLLDHIRRYAAEAASGQDVRTNERRVRWGFERLDELLTAQTTLLPHDWAWNPRK